ncbi:hypothetical protein MMC28_006841 [Mycoblastus sanguinarius]|nr:hypothetical protein [Mycoblastus sanguinarius]
MAAYSTGNPDSLANTTNGTTFAAKARAAELNAVRSRKAAQAAQAAQIENEVPSLTPVSLGALKFTKRNRGRAGWKPFELSELSEEPTLDQPPTSQPSEVGQSFTPPRQQKIENCQLDSTGCSLTPGDSPHSHIPHRAPSSGWPVDHTFIRSFSQRAEVSQTYDYEWDPDMPPANVSDYEPNGRGSVTGFSSQHSSRPTSVLSRNISPYTQDAVRANGAAPYYPHAPAPKFGGAIRESPRSQTRMGTPEESKSTNLGVHSQSRASAMSPMPSTMPAMDDPFRDHSRVTSSSSYGTNSYAQQSGFNPRAAVRMPPPAVKGTMNRDFRFPPDLQRQTEGLLIQDYTTQNPHEQAAYPKSRNGSNQTASTYQTASTAPYVRDPLPYTGFTASSKKDMLLQNLNEVVESSKAQGDLPNSTRTVLYDPVAREPSNKASSTMTGSTLKPQAASYSYVPTQSKAAAKAEYERELLKSSDPLPSSYRLSQESIYNPNRPAATNPDHANLNAYNPGPEMPVPPGFYDGPQMPSGNDFVRSLVPGSSQDRDRSLDDAWKWFCTDNRDLKYVEETLGRERAIRGGYMSGTQDENPKPVQEQKLKPIGHGRPDSTPTSATTATATNLTDEQRAIDLMGPVIANLRSYVDGSKPDYFSRYSRPPEWCIDKSPEGNRSFFGGDWGVPPPRVGRDPRYRTTIHEGRPTYFEEMGRGRGREGWGRR